MGGRTEKSGGGRTGMGNESRGQVEESKTDESGSGRREEIRNESRKVVGRGMKKNVRGKEKRGGVNRQDEGENNNNNNDTRK